MLETIGAIGAGLLYSAGTLALFVLPVYFAYKLIPDAKRRGTFLDVARRDKAKVMIGRIAVALVTISFLATLFWPTFEAIKVTQNQQRRGYG